MEINELVTAYNAVHHKTWENDDFLKTNLEISRSLYTEQSLVNRNPITKELHVLALLHGLPFTPAQQVFLINYSNKVKEILGNSMAFYVKPENLGLELCVLKWPEETYNQGLVKEISSELSKLNVSKEGFELTINGFQINPDGCFVARGIDRSGSFRKLRSHLKNTVKEFPVRQSQWVHIPLGRILEPIGKSKFQVLNAAVTESISRIEINIGFVGALKLINETQWYMEQHEVLKTFSP
tara:strand:- start:989 stop:1705 length:717 start_codon:yes stop_codon:yes gene_type:complete